MKTLNEWQAEQRQHDDVELLISNLKELSQQLELEFKSYHGQRFQGVLELIGAITEVKRVLADIEHGTVGDRKWITKFNEWRAIKEERFLFESAAPEFLQNMNNLLQQMSTELSQYQGEPFPGLDQLAAGVGQITSVLRRLGVPTA